MFAVKGWAIAADALKTQKDQPADVEPQDGASKKRKRTKEKKTLVNAENVAELFDKQFGGKDGGRKRAERNADGLSRRERKRKKIEGAEGVTTETVKSNGDEIPVVEGGTAMDTPEGDKRKPKERKSEKARKEKTGEETPTIVPAREDKSTKPTGSTTIVGANPPPPVPPKLTPLQSAMRQKLISSRFRYLNEVLYTKPSAASLILFERNPAFFGEYHEGFRRQVKAWPENPVDGFVRWVIERGAQGLKGGQVLSQKQQFRKDTKGGGKKNKKKGKDDTGVEDSEEQSTSAPKHDAATVEPLPRHLRTGLCTIADLGCGDAEFAQRLTNPSTTETLPGKTSSKPSTTPLAKKLNLQIHSFDLAAANPSVTVADIRALPLEEGSIDVAIFSLALMGTNWVEFIEEAYRVLRWKGECWIADVGSRFAGTKQGAGGSGGSGRGGGARSVVEHSVGLRNKLQDSRDGPGGGGGRGRKQRGGDDDEADPTTVDEELLGPMRNGVAAGGAVRVGGAKGVPAASAAAAAVTSATDVSPFVAVLRSRGFVLQGEPELGNKMFVRMRFLKALPATKGKFAKDSAKENGGMPVNGGRPVPKTKKFVERDSGQEEVSVEEEGRVLKPCVYKIR